jgi:hypothetical protein
MCPGLRPQNKSSNSNSLLISRTKILLCNMWYIQQISVSVCDQPSRFRLSFWHIKTHNFFIKVGGGVRNRDILASPLKFNQLLHIGINIPASLLLLFQ